MVFENIIPIKLAEQKPWNMFFVAFLFSTIAIFLALWIFPSHAAIVAVFLATLACMPLMLQVIGFEKEKEEKAKNYIKELLLTFFRSGKNLIKQDQSLSEHQEKIIWFFIFLFLGLSLSFTFWFSVLPDHMISNLFYIQLNTIREINLAITGGSYLGVHFSAILLNNIKVLAFCILFSFIYGAGAIFILVWNSSVIGVAMGTSIRSALTTKVAGITGAVGYSGAISFSIMRYLLHGIPEITAYFIGGLAGSLISIAIIKQERNSDKFKKTIFHAAGLMLLAIAVLIFSALLEVSISPMISI